MPHDPKMATRAEFQALSSAQYHALWLYIMKLSDQEQTAPTRWDVLRAAALRLLCRLEARWFRLQHGPGRCPGTWTDLDGAHIPRRLSGLGLQRWRCRRCQRQAYRPRGAGI